jgi:ribosome biogenesis GTPase / thiamine phosphate phosphatase
MTDDSPSLTGTVLRAQGGVYEVETAEGVTEATLRGRIKRDERSGDRVVAGDRVDIVRSDAGAEQVWTIERVHERSSVLLRKAPGKAPRPKAIVANVDQVMIVFAVTRPDPHLRLLDRFLVLCEANGLDALIVANKVDLAGEDAARELFGMYERIGYPVLYTAAKEGTGIERLKEQLCGTTSVLTGPSGVGKSSLLNEIQPGLGLRVAAVSQALGKGRHTTVTAELVKLDCGGYVADTPGLRELGLWGVDADELDLYFPEFEDLLGTCKYGNSCTHSHEPGCAVVAAVAAGEVSPSRYESYLRLLEGEEADGE